MKIGFIGLGRMGFSMVQNLLEHKHTIVATDLDKKAVRNISKKGAKGVQSLKEMVDSLPEKKVIWLMIPAGKPVDMVLKELVPMLKKNDIVIDGGNSYFKDSIRRHAALKKRGLNYLDCGTSGGISGARHGACMMVGGDKEVLKEVEVLFKDMCVKNGYGYMGKSGAGHFVKMVHNGIEYGMMGAINEGFLAIEKHQKTFGTNIKEVAKVYAHGSIIESRLLDWLWNAFNRKDYLNLISCKVPKGETEEEMKRLEGMAVMKILHQARLMRKTSRKKTTCGKLIAAMRNEFGGHKVISKKKKNKKENNKIFVCL